MGGLGPGDIHQLSETHQFLLLLLGQLASIIGALLLYRSSPTATKKPAPDAVPPVPPTDGPHV